MLPWPLPPQPAPPCSLPALLLSSTASLPKSSEEGKIRVRPSGCPLRSFLAPGAWGPPQGGRGCCAAAWTWGLSGSLINASWHSLQPRGWALLRPSGGQTPGGGAGAFHPVGLRGWVFGDLEQLSSPSTLTPAPSCSSTQGWHRGQPSARLQF